MQHANHAMSDPAPMMGFGRRFWTIGALSLGPAVSNSRDSPMRFFCRRCAPSPASITHRQARSTRPMRLVMLQQEKQK